MSSSMILLRAIRNIYLINDPSRQPQAQAPGSSPVGLLHFICLLKSRDGTWPFFFPLTRGMGLPGLAAPQGLIWRTPTHALDLFVPSTPAPPSRGKQ